MVIIILMLVGALALVSLPWLVLCLETGLGAGGRIFPRRDSIFSPKMLLFAVFVAVLILAWWYPLLALLLLALAVVLPILAMLLALVVWLRDQSFCAFDPFLRRCGIARSQLVFSLVAQAVIWFMVWFGFIRSASLATHNEILRICQAIPGVKAVDLIGSTNDNMFDDHGFTIVLTLNNGDQLGLSGPLWPEDLDLHQRRGFDIYRIGNFTFEGTEARPGFAPERALTRFQVVSIGNFTNGVFPFAVTSLADLVAHYDQMAAEVAQWPTAPAATRRTFQGPYGPVDYYYAVRPPNVPPDVDIPLVDRSQ
jgi:hypothetical protein